MSRLTRHLFLATLLLVAVACSDDEPLDVEAAKEQFCADVETYIEAIGRYGGLFQDVELTVGDVKNAQSELEPGLEAVETSAEEFQAAAEAEAPVEGVEIELVSPESIEAVEEAEAAFAAASDIEDRTPILEAGVDFSSAAYALEVAWVQLFLDAGCLDGDEEAQAQASQWISDYVSALQTDLRTLGYYQGEIDGIFGPQTVAAIESFQEENGLPVTGLVDPPTQAAIQAALGGQESAQVGALQAILIAAGYYDGTVDGQWSPEVEAALIAMQRDLGVEPTGVIDAATLRALQQALAGADEAPDMPSTTAPEPTSPTTLPPQTTTTSAAPTTTAATTPPTTAPVEGSVLEVLAETGQFTVFLGAVDAAGLTELLSGPGPYTVFAPTDEAFAAVTIPDDPEALSALVLYHVIEDDLDAFELVSATSVTTAQGSDIAVSVVDGSIVLNDLATLTITNVVAANGRAHVSNAVLQPPG